MGLRSLHKLTKVLLGGAAAGVVALGAFGFPKRVGLTKARAAVSMPGDLVLPSAQSVVDRSVVVEASPQSVWPYVIQLRHDFKDLWDAPVKTEVIEEPNLVIWRTGEPASEDDLDLFDASAAVVLEPVSEHETRIHVRERYNFYNPKGRMAAAVVTTASAISIYSRLRKIGEAAAVMSGKTRGGMTGPFSL